MTEHSMDAPLEPEDLAASAAAAAELAVMEARMTRALESAPPYTIPPGFAARVSMQAAGSLGLQTSRRRVVRLESVRLTVHHYGRNAAIVSLCVLLAVIVFFAHRSVGTSPLWLAAEVIFCFQFALLAVWLVARDLRQYFSAWTSQG